MEFDDFKNKNDLLGECVLYISGQSYSDKKYRSILQITKVTKTGFRIESHKNMLFDFNGYQKGLSGQMHMATVSKCKLITEKERINLINEFSENKIKKELLRQIKEIDFDKLNNEKLGQVLNILKS